MAGACADKCGEKKRYFYFSLFKFYIVILKFYEVQASAHLLAPNVEAIRDTESRVKYGVQHKNNIFYRDVNLANTL